MKAIILCAGYGKRMKLSFQKCLLHVEGEPIVNRIVKKLNECKIKDISVVVGYDYESFKNQVVKYYVNDEWYFTEEYYSLLQAWRECNDDVIIMHGDLLFNTDLLKKIIKTKGKIVALYKNDTFKGVVKFSKKMIQQILQEYKEPRMTMAELIDALKGRRYKINKVKINGEDSFFDINTKSDLQLVRDEGIQVII